MVKSIRPKFYGKVGTDEHGADSIGNGEMSSLNWTVLVGGIGACGAHVVVEFLKQ